MLGTHVWRTEDAMALFNIPQQLYTYYSNVINHCMRACLILSPKLKNQRHMPDFADHQADLTVIVPVWIPLDEHGPSNFVDNQIKTCMKSPLLLETLVALSFSHQDCLHGRLQGYRARKHTSEATKMVNSSLDTGEVEDSAIMAVAQLCITSATLAADPVSSGDYRNRSEKLTRDLRHR